MTRFSRIVTIAVLTLCHVNCCAAFTAGVFCRQSPSFTRMNVLSEDLRQTTGTPTPPSEVEAEAEADDWWKTFELNDAALPQEVRSQFPILSRVLGDDTDPKPLIYLDSAATSQKPKFVIDALTSYYTDTNSNVHRGAHKLSRDATSQYEAARTTVAKLVNAYAREEIVFTSGATEAINLVAYSWGRKHLSEGDEVITTVCEHHSNIVPWQMVCKERGAKLRYVGIVSGEATGDVLDVDALETLLSPRTKLVTFQHVSNVLGATHPLEDMVATIRSYNPNITILIDACQSVPHMPVNVQTLNVDFLAASGHKLCGPTGIGFLWGREELLNRMDPFMGGGEMIMDVYKEESSYAPAPGRFEAGTPAIAQAIGMGAAVEYIQEIGMERIHAYEVELAAYLVKRMESVEGVRILGPAGDAERAALVAFVTDGVHPSDLSTFLDMEGIAIRAGHHCCQVLHRELGYSHSARASLYFYNTKEDVDFFIEKLVETLDFFRGIGNGDDSI